MAGSQSYQVSLPSVGNNSNNSVKMLQDAITGYGKNKRDKRDDALTALDSLGSIYQDKAKVEVLKNTKKNNFNELITNDVDAQVERLYDESGNRRILDNKTDQAMLLEEQAKWEDGGYGSDPAKLKLLNDNYNKVMDAEAYSNRIYDNLIEAGVSPDVAESQRKSQLKRWKKPAMSKAAIEMAKARSKNMTESTKQQADMIRSTGKIQTQNTTGSGYDKYKSSKGKNGKSGSYFGALNADEAKKYGLRNEKDNPYSLYEVWDKVFADDQGDINDKLGNLAAAGYNKRDIGIILSMPGSVDSPNQDDASIDIDAFNKNKDKFDLVNGGKSGFGGKGGGSSKQSQTSYNTSYAPGTAKAIQDIYSDLDARQAAVWNQGNGPSQESIVEGLYNFKSKGPKVLEDNEPKGDKKTPTKNQQKVLDAMKVNKKILEEPNKTGKYIPFSVSNVEEPNPLFGPKPGFDQRVIQDKDTPWWKQNLSIAGRGRGTERTPGLQSGRFRLNKRNVPEQEQESILPNIDSQSTNQRVVDAKNKGAVTQFNQDLQERIKNNSSKKDQRAISNIVNSNQSDASKAAALREFTGGIQEAYALLAKMKNQVLK